MNESLNNKIIELLKSNEVIEYRIVNKGLDKSSLCIVLLTELKKEAKSK